MQINSQDKIVLWTKNNCPGCRTAKAFLDKLNLKYELRNIDEDYTVADLRKVLPDAKSVPQVFVNDKYFGNLIELLRHPM